VSEINEKELGRHYNTLEKLLAHPKIRAYVEWKKQRGIARQPE
jgi:hypothetical protein